MHIFITKLARLLAFIGGMALTSLILLTCLSILGRSLNSVLHSEFVQSIFPSASHKLLAMGIGPITGDFELVEAGMAFVIFCFLPLCQLDGSHASVDILTNKLPLKLALVFRFVAELVFAIILAVIAFKLFEGMESKRASGQTSYLIQFPVWWGYLLCLPGAIAASVIAFFVAYNRLVETLGRPSTLSSSMESNH